NAPGGGYYGSTMAFDVLLGKMVLTGNSGGHQQPTWTYDGTAWVALPAAGPWSYGMSSVYDTDRELWLVFGGAAGLSSFDGITWRDVTSPGPTKGAFASMVYDRERRQTVLFGGLDLGTSEDSGETWILPSFVPLLTVQP